MPKHTPGPWEVEFDDSDHSEGHIIRMASAIDSPGYHRTHHRIQYDHMLYPGDKGFEEAEANAHLIAAAPAIFALLLELEWSGEDMHDGYVYPTCPVCEGGMPDWPRTPATYTGHFDDCQLDQLITRAGGRS